jgi:hypothetical protein
MRDATERVGIPLGVIGRTLRFRRLLPSPAVLLLALDDLDPGSEAEALDRLGTPSPGPSAAGEGDE